jgi:hypothetical protein
MMDDFPELSSPTTMSLQSNRGGQTALYNSEATEDPEPIKISPTVGCVLIVELAQVLKNILFCYRRAMTHQEVP